MARQPILDGEGLEDLAAFLDGALSEEERAGLVTRLADDREAREIVVDSWRLAQSRGRGKRSGLRTGRVWLAAAAVALLAVAALFAVQRQGRNAVLDLDPYQLALLLTREEAAAPRPLYGVEWTRTRGGGSGLSEHQIAFRLGVRSVDFLVAWSSGDSTEALRLADEVLRYLSEVPLAEPAVAQYRALRDSAAVGATPNEALALAAEQLLLGILDPESLRNGHWVAAARVAAQTRNEGFLRRRDTARALRGLAEWLNAQGSLTAIRRLMDEENDVDFERITIELERLTRAGGG